jgi:hypothetical protein
LVAVLTSGQMSLCCGQNDAKLSKVLRPINKSNGMFICFFTAAALTWVGMWTCPPAIREAVTGIFLWPANRKSHGKFLPCILDGKLVG